MCHSQEGEPVLGRPDGILVLREASALFPDYIDKQRRGIKTGQDNLLWNGDIPALHTPEVVINP